jgi:hypothetical protein
MDPSPNVPSYGIFTVYLAHDVPGRSIASILGHYVPNGTGTNNPPALYQHHLAKALYGT